MLIKEVCIENLTRIDSLIAQNVTRVELCDNLSVGGTSVSYGVAKRAIELGKAHNFLVMAMVRPRGGNFVYSKDEIRMMVDDIEMLKSLKCDGVVFGCLSDDNRPDMDNIQKLVEVSNNMEIVFHMAFDQMTASERFLAINSFAEMGITRILTNGGGPNPEHAWPQWREYIEYAQGRITIMPGGGVGEHNAQWIVQKTGATELHGTKFLI